MRYVLNKPHPVDKHNVGIMKGSFEFGSHFLKRLLIDFSWTSEVSAFLGIKIEEFKTSCVATGLSLKAGLINLA